MLSEEAREFLEKIAYSDEGHENLLNRAFRQMGHHNLSKRVKQLIHRGDISTDYGIRSPPFLINDPLHAFQSTSRGQIRGTIHRTLNSGLKHIADAITAPKGFKSDMKAARGLLDLGTAHHTLMDFTAHNEKMQKMGLTHQGKPTGFGGAVQAIKQHVDHAMEMDAFHLIKNKLDKGAVGRNRSFMHDLVPKLRKQLKMKGMPHNEATHAAKKFFAKANPGAMAYFAGNVGRNIDYLKERIGKALS